MTGWGSRAYLIGGYWSNHIHWYDTVDGAWHNSAITLPGTRGFLAAVTARGKIFIVGGDSAWGKATNTLYCYSPNGDSINVRAPLPTVACQNGAAVWRDSMIYRLGGGDWNATTPPVATVEVYNILTNTWSTATSMPAALGCIAAAILGDTIVVSTGFSPIGGGSLVATTYRGVINPANPAQITWSTGANFPGFGQYMVPSAKANGVMYLIGQNGSCYSYSAGLNAWTTQPAKPTGVNYLNGAAVVGQWIHVAGGNNGSWVKVHEALCLYTYQHDAGATAVVTPVPGSQLTGGTPITPQITVLNYGANAETFTATYSISIGGSQVYSQNATVTSLAAGASQTVSFPSFTPAVGNPYTVKAWTNVTGDQVAVNDTANSTFDTYNLYRTVIVQDFTAQWCAYCPYVQNDLQRLKAEAKDSIWVMGVHASSYSDSFYTLHSLDIQNFYGNIGGYPTTVWDGTDQFVGGGTGTYTIARDMFNTHKARKAPFTMTLTGTRTVDGSSGNIRATISYPAGTSLSAKITMAIIEEAKYCVWPSATANPRSDSMREFIRDMFPLSLGDTITVPAGKGTVIKDIPFTNAAGWNKPRLDYIVWVYDPATKAIYNGGGIGYADLSPLGVELCEFTAAAGNGAVTLSWRTASETDNYQWLIERSTAPDNGFSTIAVIDASNSPNGQTYSYSDNTAAPLTDYYYRLGDKDINGNITWNGPVLVTSKGEVITSVSLAPCSPNPSHGQTTIRYALPHPAQVSLRLYDITGRLIRKLASGHQAGGSHAAPWDGKDESGREASSGVYLYQLKTGATVLNGRLTMIR